MTLPLANCDEKLFVAQRAFRAVMDAMARPGRVHELPLLAHGNGTVQTEDHDNCSTDPSGAPALPRSVAPYSCADNPWLQALVYTLIDSSCSICGEAAHTRSFLEGAIAMSSATVAAPAEARFALISADAPPEQASFLLHTLSGGSDLAPELGATAIIECTRLAAEGADSCGDAAVAAYPDSPDGLSADFPETTFAVLPQASSAAFVVTGPGVKEQQLFAASSSWWFVARTKRRDEFPCGIDLILVDRAGHLVALPRSTHIAPKGEA